MTATRFAWGTGATATAALLAAAAMTGCVRREVVHERPVVVDRRPVVIERRDERDYHRHDDRRWEDRRDDRRDWRD